STIFPLLPVFFTSQNTPHTKHPMTGVSGLYAYMSATVLRCVAGNRSTICGEGSEGRNGRKVGKPESGKMLNAK
ncbi:MAG: hypothetical protein NTV79_06910, partial [Candidatus Aureabacteria bacterium]|nr:hypothetical protein [Candidatus Auribacterota bacterium]